MEFGRRRWAIAEGYIPGWSHGPAPEMESHETLCVLNVSDAEAHLTLKVYFSDREPVGPYRTVVPARRTRHIRLSDLKDPAPIPRGTDYAYVVESDVPIVVQHTRLDSRQAESTVFSVVGFSE
jgi:hypothetical protein